ncbi:putative beta-D-xylosidase 2 [Vitis vinifera]|uniref:Putative beta-D-xylosidase 2 n=1 Tax=Vitis vinifera TaxID=29760 RepID=A0A438E1T5_VITVI|nr:putative beta-D-xylosidase 2 [Vitis vinifera]
MDSTTTPSSSSLLIFLVVLAVVSGEARDPFACDPKDGANAGFPFCRKSIGIGERVKDLIGRLTLEEKVRLLVNQCRRGAKAGNKGVITTAASFNSSLWEAIGQVHFSTGLGLKYAGGAQVVSDEARAMYNGGAAGLTFWSPNVNIFRDPRWGRGQETPGEDPVLAGKYAARYVRGLQGNAGDRLKVAACCKHFTAYDLDNWNGVDRFHFDARVMMTLNLNKNLFPCELVLMSVSKQEMEDTFDVPFRSCVVEGKVASVMCSYNQVNGVPTCADPNLLRNTVRKQWHLNGYVVSDCDSVGVFYDNQHYTNTPEEAAADAIKAGLDLDCGPFLAVHTQDAIKKGLVSEADVDSALVNTVTVQMRLGMFDGEPSAQPFGDLGPKDVCSPAHQELALEAARQGIVLLKNHGHSLPLSTRRIPCEYTTPLQGIGRYSRTIHQKGCADVACSEDQLFAGAIDAASQADATVLVMGLDQSIEAEAKDRADLLLPGRQQELVSKVAMASRGPTVLVLMSGGPVDVSFAKKDPRIAAIVWAGYPGQAGGAAIADILFGVANPGGKLPMTWYPQEYLSKVPMTTMAMRAIPSKAYPGRTYRFYKGPVVYRFGHGLSYTNFVHTIAQAPTAVAIPLHGHHNTTVSGKAIRVTHAKCNRLSIALYLDVKNVGNKDGSHTLLVFSKPPAGHWAPHKQLVAFEKVHVAARTQQRVQINIHVCKYLSVVDRSGIRRIPWVNMVFILVIPSIWFLFKQQL